ncbi:MAG: FtsH protease activity modulator HflK [Myxococcota bacterium]|jgi:modulator of FtsH protease HflK|nr:FtsH protease activity modulator HflK [Myxococcota bacterium]
MLSRTLSPFRYFGGKLGTIVLVLVVVALGVSGFFVVGPGEQGVLRTFGKHSGYAGPGPHFRIPIVQDVDVVNIENIRRIEVGFRDDKAVPSEALMLTGDENIVEAQIIIQYKISDSAKYLFRLRDPEETLRATAEVALRSSVGRTKIDDVITTGRETVQAETRDWLQKLMNEYQSGISITEVKLQRVDAPDEVKEAFHDVVRAREEKEKLINQAKGYQADLIPRARGEARQIEREAEGYKEERVLRARGDAAKFEAQLTEYQKAADVTRRRMHLETLERVLARAERKTLLPDNLKGAILPLLSSPPGAAAQEKKQ